MRFTMWGKTEQRKTEGKNLIDIPEIKAGTGSIEVICNITRNAVFSCRKEDVVTTKTIWRVQFKYKNGKLAYLRDDNISSGVVEVTEDNPIVSIVYRGMYIESGRYTDIQLEYGSSPTAYEPYTGGRPSPSPDYPQPIEITDQPVTVTIKGGTEQQSITLTPPRPFTKWDKLEKVDGVWCWVYQSRWVESYTDESITGEYISTTGGLDVGAKICYKSTPELIPLSPSEQAQLNALTMYAPETEVTNTGGCNMELTYTVDTKSYVDSKIAAISAAVLEV